MWSMVPNRAHLPQFSTRRRAMWAVGGQLQLLLDVLCSLQVQQVPLRVLARVKGRHFRQARLNLPQRGRESRIPTRRRALRLVA